MKGLRAGICGRSLGNGAVCFRQSAEHAKWRAEVWDRKRGEATGGKLFHREQRPALERNIIDTSDWTWATHRYVTGRHFWLLRYTSRFIQLAHICQASRGALRIYPIISDFRDRQMRGILTDHRRPRLNTELVAEIFWIGSRMDCAHGNDKPQAISGSDIAATQRVSKR